MTQTINPNIRFVHAPNSLNTDNCPYSGYTICYLRDENGVFFTYALCMAEDQYLKSVGREMTLKAWEAVSNLPELTEEENVKLADAYIDRRYRYGHVSVDICKSSVERLNTFSDQLVENMTMFDFKHVYISQNLGKFVEQEVILNKYPNSVL